jgi:hypothetical protein
MLISALHFIAWEVYLRDQNRFYWFGHVLPEHAVRQSMPISVDLWFCSEHAQHIVAGELAALDEKFAELTALKVKGLVVRNGDEKAVFA